MFEKLQEVYVYIYNLLFKTNKRLSEIEKKIKMCEEFRAVLKKRRSHSCPPEFRERIGLDSKINNSKFFIN